MKSTFKVLGSIALLAIAVFLTAACDLDDAPVTGITLDKSNVNLAVGGRSSIKATIKPDNAKDKGVNWSSSNPLVVSVTSKGVITGEAIGTAEITAETKDGGFTAKCAVTVSADGGGNVSLGATLSISNAQVYTRVSGSDNKVEYIPFNGTVNRLNLISVVNFESESEDLPLNEVFDGAKTVTLTSGKLSINIGTPKASFLINADVLKTGYPSLTIIPSDAKFFTLSNIKEAHDPNNTGSYELRVVSQRSEDSSVIYWYTDKNVTISGTSTEPGLIGGSTYTINFAMDLKTGWNSVVQTIKTTGDYPDYSSEITMKTEKPTANEKWVQSVYESGSVVGGGGTFTFTGIPSKYNGKYAFFQTYDDSEGDIMGFQSINESNSTITLSPISNGRVSFPVWKDIDERYSGNGSFDAIRVFIFDSQIINVQDGISFLSTAIWLSSSSVTFTNGNASMSWSQGEVTDFGEAPPAPTGVTATRDSSNPSTVYISWNYVSEASHYIINFSYEADGSEGYMMFSDSTSYTSTDNYTDSTIYFRVYAVNSSGRRSAPSSWVSVPPVLGGGGPPSPPTGVTASRSSSNPSTVNISWNGSIETSYYYEIYSSFTDRSDFYFEGSSSTTSFASTDIRTDSTVYFRVCAVNSEGRKSLLSSRVSVAPVLGGGNNDGFLGATFAITNAQVYRGKWDNEIYEYVYSPFNGTDSGLNFIVYEGNLLPLDFFFDGVNSVTLANGNLSISLGTPNEYALTNLFDDDYIPSDLTISDSDVKIFTLQSIWDVSYNRNIQTDEAEYIYADRDARISWTERYYDEDYISSYIYDLDLKAGWNSLITTVIESSKSEEYTTKTGKPTGKVKWFYNDRGYWEPEESKTSSGAVSRGLFPRAWKPRTKQ